MRASAFPKRLKKKLIRKYGGCQICGKGQIGGSRNAPILELHHIVPRSEGGQSTADNALLVCRNCHLKIHRERR